MSAGKGNAEAAARGYIVASVCVLCPIWLTALVRLAFWVGGGYVLSPEGAAFAVIGGVCLGLFCGFIYLAARYAP